MLNPRINKEDSMAHEVGLSAWQRELSTYLPHLSSGQVRWLAVYSLGMSIVQSSGLSSLSVFWATMWGQKENTVRQYLREGLYEKQAKRGQQRQELEVRSCFKGLLGWVLAWWTSEEKRLALALDATHLGDKWTVLVVSVVYRGCAIPVGWVVLASQKKGTWRPYGEDLLAELAPVIPADWQVIVLADRGLYAKWLYQGIRQHGWHPFLRINVGGLAQREGATTYEDLAGFILPEGAVWQGRVTCFKTPQAQLKATLLTCHNPSLHEHPWLILTDLPPETTAIAWYGMRTWIERGFKHTKRAGWHWEQTKMTKASRIERLWLAMSVATLWVVALGGVAEDHLPASSFDVLPLTHVARRRPRRVSQPRLLGCFKRGILTLITSLLAQHPLPHAYFCPEPWSPPLGCAHA
jgi:hypothetical protein